MKRSNFQKKITNIWLNKWLQLNKEQKVEILTFTDGDYDELDIENVIKSSEKLFEIKNICDELLYELINVRILTRYWDTNVKTEDVFKIIKKIYHQEIELLKNDKIVFYHGQTSSHGLLNYVFKISSQRANIKNKNSKYYLYWNENCETNNSAIERAIEMGTELEDFFDAMPNFSSRLLSVNYSLFGNHRLWQVGESSLHYFIYNYSQNYASDYVNFIPHINEEEKKSILLLFKELESKRKEHYGRLISFIFPKNKIDNYLYNSLVDGKMSSIKKSLNLIYYLFMILMIHKQG